MDIQDWKDRIRQRLAASAHLLRKMMPGMTYGAISASTILPVVTAVNGGDYAALVALTGIAGGVGGNLIANQIQKWHDKDEAQLAEELFTLAEKDPEWRDALDALLLKLETPRVVQAILGESEWDRFQEMLREELVKLRNEQKYEIYLTRTNKAKQSGSGAIAQDHSVAAGAGGVAARTIHGSVTITHTSTTPPDPTAPDPESLRTAYLNRVYQQAQALSLGGIDPRMASEADTRLELSAVYTGLLTQQSDGREELMVASGRGQEMKRISAVEQLNRHRLLVLLGDPGSGKSTFVNFVTLCLAGEALGQSHAGLQRLTEPLPVEDEQRNDKKKEPQPQPWKHGALLPVRVILRDFAATGLPALGQKATAEDLWRFIDKEIADALPEYCPMLRNYLREQGGLVLLDGLDEVPEAHSRRTQIKQAVEDFVSVFPRCRILVTSRTYAYQQQDWRLRGFAEAYLAPFTSGQINRFIERWYAHIGQLRHLTEADSQGRATLLKTAIERSQRLQDLAERPLLLTLMASLHAWRGGSLPEKREELYNDAVDLLLDWWENQRIIRRADGSIGLIQPSLAEFLKVDREKMRLLLNRLAYEAHSSQPNLMGTADVPEAQLVSGLLTLSNNPDVKHLRLIEYLRDRAGLLIPRGVGVYTFPHRTFQEYLAACHLTDTDYPETAAELVRKDPNRWREVALLAGAKAARGAAATIWNLVDALSFRSPTAEVYTTADDWGALLAGQALVESANLGSVSERNQPKLRLVKEGLLHVMRHSDLPAIERAEAGRSLAKLGDPRVEVLDPLAIEFCSIPAGEFWMGEEEEAHLSRSADYDYQISRYPITQAQFWAFVEAGGYAVERYWQEAKAHKIWRNGQVKGRYDNEPRDKPLTLNEPFMLSNHPLVGVTWYEALAFTRWLTEQMRAAGRLAVDQIVTVPSEAEWEKAARAGDKRIYPWGDSADPNRANYDESGIGATNAVGCFPGGTNFYKVEELSGNVWEWTRSLWDDYPYPSSIQEQQQREHLGSPDSMARVLRGGTFEGFEDSVRCTYRNGNIPYFRGIGIGFRVVVVVSPFTSGL